MACAIKRSILTSDNANTIRSMLIFKPELKFNQYKTKNQWSTEEKIEPITFYIVDAENIHLPYLFAASLFQMIPNADKNFPTTSLTFSSTLRENQIPVVTEAWQQLLDRGTTTLGLHPGFGKTILGAKLAANAKLLTLVYVHREILTVQWKKTFTEHTNAKVWIVGEKHPPQSCDVIICMDTRWQQIPEIMRDQVGFLIIDEAHCFCTRSHVNCLLAFHPKYIVAETASYFRDDEMHIIMQAICGTHGVFREINKPFNVVKVKTNTKPERKMNRMGGVDWTALLHDTLMDPRRNKIIIDIIRLYRHKKILVLTSLVEHVMLLHEELKKTDITCDYLCGTKKNYIDGDVLVASSSKCGVGFDSASFCETFDGRNFDLLILVTSMKKYGMLTQNVGRAFRSDHPTVLHFVDNDDIFKRHWYKAKKWYLLHGATLTDWNIPNVDEPTVETRDISTQQEQWIRSKIKNMGKKKDQSK